MAMFSDFTLKSLISTWDKETLGPNPFKKVRTTGEPIDLAFDNEELKRCPSAQLQVVG